MTAAEKFPTEWTPEVAHRLAQPFADEQVGKLPKVPKSKQNDDKRDCRYCGGWHQPISDKQHVDYIGHAIVTDRLNSVVGPHGWSWSLLTVERDSQGKLLAVVGEMSVLGHTKGPEIGTPAATQHDYGDALKSAISDYLCRAAMRFGVALDLWAKQQLESAAAPPPPQTTAAPAAQELKPGGPGDTTADGKRSESSGSPDRQVEDGPPGFDAPRFGGPGAARSWLRHRDQDKLRPLVEETLGGTEHVGDASLDDLQAAIDLAFRKAIPAA